MINWKVRFRHPAFISAVLALIGYILVDSSLIDAGKWETLVELFLGVFVAGGVVVDPTTKGLKDSTKAMTYEKPREW
ncbi:MAG TPA: phage holin [Paenisporosarcina sp.]|nr:phage holin [Paenisporosarcina sp.]